jgi:hypothetical protein
VFDLRLKQNVPIEHVKNADGAGWIFARRCHSVVKC